MSEAVWSYPKYRTFLDLQQTFENTALFAGRDLSCRATPIQSACAPKSSRIGILEFSASRRCWARVYRRGSPSAGRAGRGHDRSWALDTSLQRGSRHRRPHDPDQLDALHSRWCAACRLQGADRQRRGWVPFAVYEPAFMTQRYAHGYYLVARRKAGVSEAQAIAARCESPARKSPRSIANQRRGQIVERNGGISLFIARRR